jgi:hypothetical protein
LGVRGYNGSLQVVSSWSVNNRGVSLPPGDPAVEKSMSFPCCAELILNKGLESIYLQHILDEAHGSSKPGG